MAGDALRLSALAQPAGFRPGRKSATGPPGSYPDRTFTGKRRRAYGHEDPPWRYVMVSPPSCWAHRKAALIKLFEKMLHTCGIVASRPGSPITAQDGG